MREKTYHLSEKEHDPLFPVHQPKGMGLCAG